MPLSIHGTNGITFNDGSTQNTRAPSAFKNRIINGDMRIDQRGNGASVALSSSGAYPVDRFPCYTTSGSGNTAIRSTTVPSAQGFVNSLLITVGTGAAPSASSYNQVGQVIEGFNVADLGYGGAGAKTVNLSFWVRASIAGTYCVAFLNTFAAGTRRTYIAEYTISSANTFEYKTVTIVGDTSGTWYTDNGQGLQVWFDIGSGSNYQGSGNAWVTGAFFRTSNQTNLIATNGATFYITGVQLEAGSTATDFERRPIGTELALCQRYYQKTYDLGTAPGTATTVGAINYITYGAFQDLNDKLQVEMRGIPSEVMIWNPHTGTSGTIRNYSNSVNYAATINGGAGTTSSKQTMFRSSVPATGNNELTYHITASAEL